MQTILVGRTVSEGKGLTKQLSKHELSNQLSRKENVVTLLTDTSWVFQNQVYSRVSRRHCFPMHFATIWLVSWIPAKRKRLAPQTQPGLPGHVRPQVRGRSRKYLNPLQTPTELNLRRESWFGSEGCTCSNWERKQTWDFPLASFWRKWNQPSAALMSIFCRKVAFFF